MKEKTQLTNAIEMADEKIKYDSEVKKVLSNKHILAWILKGTVAEFKDAPIHEIIGCIEGEPEVTTIPVQPGKTNKKPEAIIGLPTEDKVPNEGGITFDIRFFVRTLYGERVKMIINVEAQKKYHAGYDLVTRAIFYCARMISAQKDTEFTGEDFDSIKKVYSIWICMDTTRAATNTITEYKITRQALHGEDPTEHRYDLMTVVMVCLGDRSNNDGTVLHEMLSVLLSEEICPQKKVEMLNQEYSIPITKGEVEYMCNLSDLIEEKGMEKGKELTLLDSIKNLMETLHLSAEQAMSALRIPEGKWSFYKSKLMK